MKTFINDYADLCKHTAKFYKKHMLGVTVVNTAIVGGMIVIGSSKVIKNKIKDKIKKNEVIK